MAHHIPLPRNRLPDLPLLYRPPIGVGHMGLSDELDESELYQDGWAEAGRDGWVRGQVWVMVVP